MKRSQSEVQIDCSVKCLQLSQDKIDSSLKEIQQFYLNGDLVLIKNFRPPVDLSYFDFKPIKRIEDIAKEQKQLDKKYLQSLRLTMKKPIAETIAPIIYKDKEKAKEFLAIMKSCNKYMENLFKQIFEIDLNLSLKDTSTWRFSITEKEIYHLDDYSGLVLRAFWNLSPTPRKWGIGHKINDLLKIYSIELNDMIVNSLSTGSKLDHRIINSYLTAQIHSLSNKPISFEQYDLWICDSTKVAHQVYAGNKMAAFSFIPKGDIPIKRSIFERLNYISYLFQ